MGEECTEVIIAGKDNDKKETIYEIADLMYHVMVLMVEAGMGCALCLDGIIRCEKGGALCFRPLEPRLEVGLAVAWKKYQVLSRAAEQFLDALQKECTAERGAEDGGGAA